MGSETRGRDLGLVLMIGTALMWGTSGTISKYLPQGASSMSAAWTRIAVAAVMLNGVAFCRGGYARTLMSKYAVAAGACMALNQMGFFGSMRTLGVTLSTMLVIGSSLIMAGLLGIPLGEKPSRLWWCAAALGVAGCALTGFGDGTATFDALGLCIGLAGAFGYAMLGLCLKKLAVFSPDGLQNNAAATFYASFILLVPVWGKLGWLASPGAVVPALALGLIPTAIPYCLFSAALKRITVGQAYAIGLLEPLVAGLLGLFLLGEHISAPAAVGMAAQATCMILSAVDTVRR